MPHGTSTDKRHQILKRVKEILREEFRPLTTTREKQLLGFDLNHVEEDCRQCQLGELQSWRVAA